MNRDSKSAFTFANLAAGARFFAGLPWHLRHPLDIGQSRTLFDRRLLGRREIFLDRMRSDVYACPDSPYLALLRHAGCEMGDIERAVRESGVEGALRTLFRSGVYLTVDEFKGRRPVVRGGLKLEIAPEQLRSPRAAYHLPASSGGSRSGGTPVLIDMRFIRACASACALSLDAWGGRDWVKGDWETLGAGSRFRLVKLGSFGTPPDAWFSQIDPGDPDLASVFRWNTRALRWSSALALRPLPAPLHAPVFDPAPVAGWMVGVLRSGRAPFLLTFPASAVALCRYALERGIDIAGGRIMIGGEPITAARAATIRKAGCTPIPRYGSVECGPIGYGCRVPAHPDEVHFQSDLHALIQAEAEGEAIGLPPGALLITALHPQSPFLLINVSMGDQAAVEERPCGCPLESLGLTTHLRDVRSFEKLTGGGVTFLGTEVIPILEEVLPARFGGGPTDYQLVEEEAGDGRPVLRLLVSPALGPLDHEAVAELFLSSLGAGSQAAGAMEKMWRDSAMLRVERRLPAVTRAGKVLHLHLARSRPPGGAASE